MCAEGEVSIRGTPSTVSTRAVMDSVQRSNLRPRTDFRRRALRAKRLRTSASASSPTITAVF
jgi:hypothetical protein